MRTREGRLDVGATLKRAVGDALVAICRSQTPAVPDAPGVALDVVAAARYHRIAPLVHVALREQRPDLAGLLKSDRDEALFHHLRVSAILADIARQLDGIAWLSFKGPMLSEFAHPIPGLRFYKDIDVLVSPTDFRSACHGLLAAGWVPLLADSSLGSAEFPGELPLGNAQGIVLDLHWSMVVMRRTRRHFFGDARSLLDRRMPVSLGPARLWALSPADALVHVCHHAALIGATKLGHVLDADQLSRQVEDWDEVVERAEQWGAGVQVAAVLGRAHHLLGSPIPAGMDRRLGLGTAMGRFTAEIDHRFPIQELRRDESWTRLLTRSLKRTVTGTAAEVGRRVMSGTLHRLLPARDSSAFTPATSVVLEDFLDRVTATGAAPSGRSG